MIVTVRACREGFKLPEDEMYDSRPGMIVYTEYRICMDDMPKHMRPNARISNPIFQPGNALMGTRRIMWKHGTKKRG